MKSKGHMRTAKFLTIHCCFVEEMDADTLFNINPFLIHRQCLQALLCYM
jgi:hypothetical protein